MTYDITLDVILHPFAVGVVQSFNDLENLSKQEIELKKTIARYDAKTYLYNAANIALITSVALAIFMNIPVASAVFYGAVSWGVRYVAEKGLKQMERAATVAVGASDSDSETEVSSRIFNIFQNLGAKEVNSWVPEWVNFCGWTILRRGLPSDLEPLAQPGLALARSP